MKNEYLKKLKEYLEDRDIQKEQINELVNDYSEFYEEYLNKGLTDEEITLKLGTPREIYRNNRSTLSVVPDNSVIKKLTSLSPFVATSIFILIGFLKGVWHPTWLVYFIIPILGSLESRSKLVGNIGNVLIFVGIATAIILPHYNLLEWKYSWLFMLLFIFFSIIRDDEKLGFKIIFLQFSLLASIISYIVLVYYNVRVPLSLLSFLFPFIVSIWTKHIEININLGEGIRRVIVLMSIVLSICLFLIIGVTLNNWGYIWQILLLPIMISIFIIKGVEKHKITAIMPFISLMIFYNLGYFYSLWTVSWLAFLLIPVTAILEERPTVEVSRNE